MLSEVSPYKSHCQFNREPSAEALYLVLETAWFIYY